MESWPRRYYHEVRTMSDEEIEISEELQKRIDEAKELLKDYLPATLTISADWWYVAAYLFTLTRNSKNTFKWETQAHPNLSVFTATLHGEEQPAIYINIIGAQHKTYVLANVKDDQDTKAFIANILELLELFGSIAATYHRKDTRLKFGEIVELYYQRRREGENPNLRALADQYGVKYGSLRQFKMRYDAERKRTQE